MCEHIEYVGYPVEGEISPKYVPLEPRPRIEVLKGRVEKYWKESPQEARWRLELIEHLLEDILWKDSTIEAREWCCATHEWVREYYLHIGQMSCGAACRVGTKAL